MSARGGGGAGWHCEDVGILRRMKFPNHTLRERLQVRFGSGRGDA